MFACTICQRVLSCKEALKNHILSKHLKIRAFICDICSKTFILRKSLLLHQKIHNRNGTAKTCHCGKEFKTLFSYRYHISRNHQTSSSSLKCSFCQKSVMDRRQLRYHMLSRHAPKKIPCTSSSCKKMFTTKTQLHDHLRMHSNNKYECSVCLQKFKSKYYMESHKLKHSGILPYECSECKKKYTNLSHLNFHWKRAHSEIQKFLCSFCGKVFKSKYEVVLHECSHKKKLQKEDKTSKKQYDTKRIMKHLRPEAEREKKNVPHYKENPSGLLRFKCLDCEKCFKTAVRANEHWRRYHLVKTEFKCSFCECLFQSEKQLREHNTSHRDNCFKCDLCSFETQHRIALHSHKNSHLKNLQNVKISEENSYIKEEMLPSQPNELKNQEDSNNLLSEHQIRSHNLQLPKKIKDRSNKFHTLNISAKSHQPLEELKKRETVKIKGRKTKSSSPFSNVNFEDSYPWESNCYELSGGLNIDQLLFSSLELSAVDHTSKWSEDTVDAPQSSAIKTSNNNGRDFIPNYSSRNPKLTLNCTARNDGFEENELYF